MTDLFNAVLLGLAWFASANVGLSLFAWGLAAGPAGRGATSAARLLAIRLLPGAGSLLFAGAIFAPAHWRFEPRGGEEAFGAGVHLLAGLGLVLLLRSGTRLAATAQAGWRLRACNRLPRLAERGALPVFEIAGLPGVSLAGILRPRILVGRPVREALTTEELEVAVAHEVAHRSACDNWKRLALYCTPDVFGLTRAAIRLEAAWAALAECEADARAVSGSRARAAHLASALVKVARLRRAPNASLATHAATPAWSTLHDEPLLATRVHRLVAGDPAIGPARVARRTLGVVAVAVCTLLLVGALGARALHDLTETIAHALP